MLANPLTNKSLLIFSAPSIAACGLRVLFGGILETRLGWGWRGRDSGTVRGPSVRVSQTTAVNKLKGLTLKACAG